LVAGGVGVVPWGWVLAGMFWITGVAGEGMAAGEVLVKLWLLWGGVALCWAGEPTGLSTFIGDVSAHGWVDAAAAYEWGAVVGMGVVASSWEAGGGSMSIGMEDVSLVHLEAGVLTLVVGEPRKVKRLPSLLEGPAFQPGAMVRGRAWPIRGGG